MEQALQHFLAHLKSGRAQGLDALFQRLGDSGPYRIAPQRYPLTEVDPLKPTFPLSQPGAAGQGQSLATALEQRLPDARTPEAQLTLLERFGGFVAATDASGQEVGGVSWFDQARLSAALDACGEQVLVVRADLSGIQEFIYQAESEKALKSLRARSFYLELLAVHALRHLLALGQVTRANVAYLGGGGFQLYLPARLHSEVQQYAQSVDDWLWQAHQGTLGFSLACELVSRSEAEQGRTFQRRLSESLGRQKARRRAGQLAALFRDVRSPIERQTQEDTLAQTLTRFGGLLPRATHIEYT